LRSKSACPLASPLATLDTPSIKIPIGHTLSYFEHNEYTSETFKGKDFYGETISGVEFDRCSFIDCNFMQTTFDRCQFVECEFSKCNLSVARMEYSKFSEVTFRGCKALGVDWSKAVWPRLVFSSPINFHESVINDSSFYGLSLQDIAIEGCTAYKVDFRNADFSKANFTHTDFQGSIFSDTNLSHANFVHAINFNIDIFKNQIKKAKFDRFEAVRLLDSLDIELVD
jgi:uncharacterized protein YjbI with pentapeptide repeats